MISEFSSNASALTSLLSSMWPRIAGSATSLPIRSSTTAAIDPASPHTSPSSMNGPRTNQFVAPTSFITSISRRREKIESRIVFAIRSVEATSRITTASRKIDSMTFATLRMRLAVFWP